MSLSRFTELWTSPHYPPEPVFRGGLDDVEQRLNVRLPRDYRQAILLIGLPRPTISLLHTIVDGELDLHAVGDFYAPSKIVEETIGWREISMPEHLVAFANDGCGNQFCFDVRSSESSGVWFYDHDFQTTSLVAVSFDAWVEAFCRLTPLPEGKADACRRNRKTLTQPLSNDRPRTITETIANPRKLERAKKG